MAVLPALALGILEFSLRVMGVGFPTGFVVRAPSGAQDEHLVDNYQFAWRFFPKQLARTPQPIRVPLDKPAGVRRILVLGGSAAMGDPEAAFGMPRILQTLLRERFPKDSFEVINAGVTAVNSHVVRSIAADCRVLSPDAWVIYLGNNEVHGPYGAGTVFGETDTPLWLIRSGLTLQKTRLGQAIVGLRSRSSAAPKQWGGMEMFLESQVPRTSAALSRVYQNFEANLRDIVRSASRDGNPVLLSTVATNLRDSPPFSSLHTQSLSTKQRDAWSQAFQEGSDAQSRGDFLSASSHYHEAYDIDPSHAELLYRMAECQRERGELESARKLYAAARDADTLRFRADTEINNRIRAIGKSAIHSTPPLALIDAEQIFKSLAADNIPGGEFFHEHVHFNFHGNYLLARQFADELAKRWELTSGIPWPTESECAERMGWSPWHQLTLHRKMQVRLSSPPFTQQCFHEKRMAKLRAQGSELAKTLTPQIRDDTVAAYRDLLAERPDDWTLRELYADLLESVGDLTEATEQFRRVTNLIPHRPEGHFHLGRLLNRQSKWTDAESSLRRALEVRPNFARAANSLGIALSRQQNLDESTAWFDKAVQMQPSFGEATYNWGLVLAEQGDDAGAMEKFLEAVERDPNYVLAHDRIAKRYVEQEQWRAALPHYQAVARLQPRQVNSQLNLGLLYGKLIQSEEASGDADVDYVTLAIQQFENILRIQPDHDYAKAALQHLHSLPKPN